MNDTTKYEARGVLAGCYKGKLDICLTHAYVNGAAKTLCGKIKEAHLCGPNEVDGHVDCPHCLKKMGS